MRLADLLLASYDPHGVYDDGHACDDHNVFAGAAAAAAVVVSHQPQNSRALVIIARVAAARYVPTKLHLFKPICFTHSRADIDKAREMFEKAIAASSGGVSPVGVYGAYAKFLWATGGDRAKVVEFFEKACAGASNADATCAADAAAAADVMASYASFLLAGGGAMTARGEQLLRASLTLQPRNATTLTRYAHFLMDFMGDTANAGRLLEAAVMVDPRNASAATSYASYCFSRKGDPAAASAVLEACCSGDHRPPLALAALAEFRLVKQGNIDAARDMYAEVAACEDADGPSLASAAWFYAQYEGNYGKGRQLLERAVKMCCDDAVLWGSLGVALMCNIHGDRKRSADAYTDADADDVDADNWIAESIARAQHCFAIAEKLDPNNVDNLCNFAVFFSEIAGDISRAKGQHSFYVMCI